jgi:LacI family transcriptional regulator
MAKTKRIALFYPLASGLSQEFVRGIFSFARPTKPWEFCLIFDGDAAKLLRWKPDAIICHAYTANAVRVIEKARVPVVETGYFYSDVKVPRVGLDHRAAGKMAAEHFLDRGFTQFAFFGGEPRAFTECWREGFGGRLRTAGHDFLEALPDLFSPEPFQTMAPVDPGVRSWLLSLPRPVALFAGHDPVGFRLIEVVRSAGLHVPEDVAVIGVGNNDLACEMAFPPLSSVCMPAKAVGYAAAKLLDELMEGGKPPEQRTALAPTGVATRQSTDIYVVSDQELAAALRFIRENAGKRIGVKHVVEAATIGRSALEKRFRALLGRSPLEEIRRVRMELARRLLADTHIHLAEVANLAGFRDGAHLSLVFAEETGISPTEYRKSVRSR